jgi:hypothetical protein
MQARLHYQTMLVVSGKLSTFGRTRTVFLTLEPGEMHAMWEVAERAIKESWGNGPSCPAVGLTAAATVVDMLLPRNKECSCTGLQS